MSHVRPVSTCVVFFALSSLVGCIARTGSVETNTTSLGEFHRLLDEQRFCQAYVSYVRIRPELEEMDEQAGGFEYHRLVAGTAGVGEASWIEILKSPAIPLDYKLDLVREIDEDAHRANP